ncbi:metallophosphoesterase [Halarcobacter ebronensis]|uniref:Serine/threonine protein phosphatase n=1 Tax=Halarcobacter ebronensis TaxID=1462615 RepID=A0A4Q1AMH2_9BACT|nr:metallophosphoesterase [Halarcobacter ebronensis]QKF82187.1 metallophosphoesterase [Halarcobacter ebronensis]RXK03435.1 serine/threonine protein phosphatase [Halarcobacter ebronensis]
MSENKIYIIGDVHGCFKTLIALIKKLPKNARICFVGDLIDRGSNSSKVVDFVKKNNFDCVLGNHELFMIEDTPKILENRDYMLESKWIQRAGGYSTLKSYNRIDKIQSDVEYFKNLPLFIEYKDIKTKDGRYLVVSHSSVEENWKFRDYPIDSFEYEEFKHSTLFSRYKNYDNKEIYNVYGHTPTTEPIIKEFRAQIDLGCCYSKNIGLIPRLCALEFPSLELITQENIED